MVICIKCSRRMVKEKSGVVVAELLRSGQVYKLWYADLFRCPECSIEVISDLADHAFAEKFTSNFTETLDRCKLGKIYEWRNSNYGEGME